MYSTEAPIFTVKAPAPAITSLSPASVLVGGPDFTLTVNGSNFLSGATVAWNGAPLSHQFVSAAQLTALVPAALIASAGTASVTVTGDGATSNALAFTIALPGPATSSAGILNAASSLPAIAPGTLIAIFGSNLATSHGPILRRPAAHVPRHYFRFDQRHAGSPPVRQSRTSQRPGPLRNQSRHREVSRHVQRRAQPRGELRGGGHRSWRLYAPDSNHVLALNLADGTINASQTPARPGQYVTAYLTGQGLVDPPVTTGDVAPASPFSMPVAAVQIKIGGRSADIQFAGMAPGFVGLMQMNVLIPDVPPGEQSFDVSIGGVAAATTTISIGPRQ